MENKSLPTGTHTRHTDTDIACDICNQPITPDEKFHDGDGEIVHTVCASQWFRGNFGREGL
jgi:hypothetical protein